MKFLSNPTQRLLTLFLFFTIFSCKKETSDTDAQDEALANISATESNAEADDVFNGVFDDVLGVNTDVGMGGTGIFGRKAALTTEQVMLMAVSTILIFFPLALI